jgi:Domain of unknown function (DUF4115)
LVEPLKPKEGSEPNIAAIAIIGLVTVLALAIWLGAACWTFGSNEPVPSQGEPVQAQQTPEGGSGPTPTAQPTPQVRDVPANPAGAPVETFGPQAVTPVSGRVTVGVAAQTDARLRITVDGTVAFEGTLAAGERQAWDGSQRIQVWTDSGRTLLLAVNGQNLGPYSTAMGHPDWNTIDFGFWPGWTR